MYIVIFSYGKRYLGYGLSTDPDYDRWYNRRSFFNHGFHRKLVNILS
jgi:hypothetical protein